LASNFHIFTESSSTVPTVNYVSKYIHIVYLLPHTENVMAVLSVVKKQLITLVRTRYLNDHQVPV